MRIRRALTAHAAVLAAVLALATPSAADPRASDAARCTPYPRATTGPSGGPADDRASCLHVDVRLSHAPATGAQARLDIEVRTTSERSAVALDVRLPAGLVWVDVPEGLRSRATSSRVPADRGRAHQAEGRGHTGRQQPWRLSGTVRAVATGSAGIRVAATSPDGDTDTGSVFLDIGARSSSFGIAVKPVNPAAPAKAGATRAHDRLAHRPAGPASARPASAGTACATGTWNYVDHTGATRVSANARVQIYDDDTRGADDLLATGLTGPDGRYRLCFDNADGDGGGQDVYAQLSTENDRWVIRHGRSRQAYRFTTPVSADVPTGGTADFGAFQPADAALMRGVEAFDTMNAGWNWTPGTACWDAGDTVCRRGIVNWAPDSTDGTYYSTQGNAVHLAAEDPDAPILVLHEFGHAIMDDVYEDDFPDAPDCSPHYIHRTSSTGCAWTEGFATWYGAVILGDPTFRWPDGRTRDLEGPTWSTPEWDNGDTVEGRVVAAMIDLADSADEPGESCAEDPAGPLWNTFLHHVSGTFAEFWAQRAADGYDVGPAALDCLHHNTIDYRA